ncbi:MAG: hypothetical protein ACE5DM_01375 [Candidatus Nanoarchaeia archaeon]
MKQKKSKKTTRHKREEEMITKPIIGLIIVVALLTIIIQLQINNVSAMVDSGAGLSSSGAVLLSGEKDLANINLEDLKSTGHTIAAVFPVEDIQTSDDAIRIMFPTGTPEYGDKLGVSYDTPVESLAVLAKMYRGLKDEVQQNNPEGWQRFMNLASKPVGISCEYCCGVGPIGIDKKGNSACGCQHNPALLSVALYLSAYSDYNDGEILREVMKWKTLFFPKNMIEMGMTVAGGDTSSLKNLPGMVGGC